MAMVPVEQKRQLRHFFSLSFLITWVLVLPLVLSAQGVGHVSEVWHPLGAWGPVGAALLITWKTAGRSGLSTYWQQFALTRTSLPQFFFWSLSPFLLYLMGFLGLRLAGFLPGAQLFPTNLLLNGSWLAPVLLTSAAYGFGEEAGWRGFALPRLLERHSPFRATLILTSFWAAWHTPMFFYRFEFGVVQVIGFFLGLWAGAILFTFLYRHTHGSVLICALWHTNWNIVNLLAMEVSDNLLSLLSAQVMIIAVMLLVWRRKEFFQQPEKGR